MRIFIDIGAFRPERGRIEGVTVRRGEHQFEASIPARASEPEIHSYALRQAGERFLEFFVPSMIAIIVWCVVYDWGWFLGSVAAVIAIGGPAAFLIHRRVVGALEPLRAGWSITADRAEIRLYRHDGEGQEVATHVSFRDLQGMNSHRIEDEVLFDYMHDQFSNELEFTSARGGVRFAEGLDFETCEEIVTAFGKYVDLLRSERAAANMPGIAGLE